MILVWTKTAFARDGLKVKTLPTHFVPTRCVALLLRREQKTTHNKISLPYGKIEMPQLLYEVLDGDSMKFLLLLKYMMLFHCIFLKMFMEFIQHQV